MLQYVQDEVKRLKQARNVSDPIKAVAAVLGIDPARIDREKIALEHLPEAKWGYPHLHRALIHAERDLTVPFMEAVFPDAPPGALVCFTDTPVTLKLKEIGFFINIRRQVISADARGFGELEPRPSDYDIYSWCSMDRSLSDLLCLCGESSLGAQTCDVLRVLHTVQSESIMIYGKGEAALPVLFAGILNNKVRKIILDSFLGSFEALAVEVYPSWKRYQYLQDVLKSFDIPEILAGCADKQFLLMNPLDAQKRQLNQEQASSLFGPGHPNITLQVTENMAKRLISVEKPCQYCVSEAIRKWSPC